MSEPERVDFLALGSGEAGKFLAWHMASAGHRTVVVERKLIDVRGRGRRGHGCDPDSDAGRDSIYRPARRDPGAPDLRAVQLLLGHTKLESTVRYLGIEVDAAHSISEQVEL